MDSKGRSSMNREGVLPFPAKRFDTFESVMKIDAESQRRLLHVGDEVEQVWAAWALGLKLGARITPSLSNVWRLPDSPEPAATFWWSSQVLVRGARWRNTLVSDPAPLVRATACRYLARTAEPGDARTERFLFERLREDTSPEVREAISRSWAWIKQAGAPPRMTAKPVRCS